MSSPDRTDGVPAGARPLQGAEADALLAELLAIYEAGGPPPRKTLTVCASDGTPRIRLGGLFIECAICGMYQPQSRSRQSVEARRLWIEMHLRCPE